MDTQIRPIKHDKIRQNKRSTPYSLHSLFGALLLGSVFAGSASAQTGGILPLVSVGERWPQAISSYNITVTSENANKPIDLEIYSPTLNLADYADHSSNRRRGPNYFGDELYRKTDKFSTTFTLKHAASNRIVLRKTYGMNRSHDWTKFFPGGLPAGKYTLTVSSKGWGKNSFALRTASAFSIETSDFSVNARDNNQKSLLAARFYIPNSWVGQKLSLTNYDMDGPKEAQSWVILPSGRRQNLTSSPNGRSATNSFQLTQDMVGEWQVYIRVLSTTKQYSNAIRYTFKINGRPLGATITPNRPAPAPRPAPVAPAPAPKPPAQPSHLAVEVVDTQGNPVPNARHTVKNNIVKLQPPQGYFPVRNMMLQGSGNTLSPTEIRYVPRPGTNRVRFVVEKPELIVDVVDPQGIPIQGASHTKQGNVVRPRLPQGYVPVSSSIVNGPGKVVSPTELRYQPQREGNHLRFVADKPVLIVDVVDTAGTPIPGASYLAKDGVARPQLPKDYIAISSEMLEGEGQSVSPAEVRYQLRPGTNRIRFVAEKPELIVDVVDPQGLPIQGATFNVQGNTARPQLPQGYIPIKAAVLDGKGTVLSPTEIRFRLQPGVNRLRFVADKPQLIVDVVDRKGSPIPEAEYEVKGNTARPKLPAGYIPVSSNVMEGRGETLSPTEIRFQLQPGTNHLRFVAEKPELVVEIVDTLNRPITAATYEIDGNIVRPQLPKGYTPISSNVIQGKGDIVSPTEIRYHPQPGTNRLRFVARQPEGRLIVEAVAIYGSQRVPLGGVPFNVGGKTMTTPATMPLMPGDYPIQASDIRGSVLTAPKVGRVPDGGTGKVLLEYNVETEIILNTTPDLVNACDVVQLNAVASTQFPYRLPARININLPNGWTSDYPLEQAGEFSADQPLNLRVPVRVCRTDSAEALLAPTGLRTTGQARVRNPGGANVTRQVQNGAKATLFKNIEASAQGYDVTMQLTVDSTIEDLRIHDPLPPSGTRPAVRSSVKIQGPSLANVSPRADGDNIVLSRVIPGTYTLTYTLYTDEPSERVLTAPSLSW